MPELSPVLAPWSQELAGMAPDLASALAPWLLSLERLLPAGRIESSEVGEVNGYSGIGPRGTLDRMLVSDWLIANELPDEFLRRFSQGELAYLQFDYHSPQDSHADIVLFDSGPDQLGLPRLAHIALFVVLARRAFASGTPFLWGALQDQNYQLFDDVGESAIKRLLLMRSLNMVSNEQQVGWRERTAPGSRLIAVTRGRSAAEYSIDQHIIVEPQSSTAGESLKVSVATRALARSTELHAPPPSDCIRLIRTPYPRPSLAATAMFSGEEVWGFTNTAKRLIAVNNQELRTWKSPQVDDRPLGRPLAIELPSREALVGVQYVRNQLLVLVETPGALELRWRNTMLRYTMPAEWVPRQPTLGIPACWTQRSAGNQFLYFVDGAKTLWQLEQAAHGSQPKKVSNDVVATLKVEGDLRYWCATEEGLEEMWRTSHNQIARQVRKTPWPTGITADIVISDDTILQVDSCGPTGSCCLLQTVQPAQTRRHVYLLSGPKQNAFTHHLLPEDVTQTVLSVHLGQAWVVFVDHSNTRVMKLNSLNGEPSLIHQADEHIDALWPASNSHTVAYIVKDERVVLFELGADQPTRSAMFEQH